MAGIYLSIFLLGALVGAYVGIVRTVHDIKKYPVKWEEFGIFQRKTDSYTMGWAQGLRDERECRSTISALEDAIAEAKLAEELAQQVE